MRFDYRTRASVMVGIIVLLTLASSMIHFVKGALSRPVPDQVDEMVVNEARFVGVKDTLPELAVVGYLDEQPDDPKRLIQAQYALAPLIIVRGVAAEFVLGNFRDSASAREAARTEGLALLEDFGNGVALYRRPSGAISP